MRRLILLIAVVLTGCESGESPSEIFEFTFQPPDSVMFVVELGMKRTTSQGDQQMLDSTWTRTRHYQVAAEGGYELTGITDSIVVFRDGIPVIDPIVNLFMAANITYLIDTAGRAVGVQGYDEVFAGLDSLVGPDTAAAIRQMVSPQTLQDQEVQTWNTKFAGFVGRQLRLGEPSVDTSYPVLPVEGELASYTITELTDTVRINSHLCARLRITSCTDPSELAHLAEKSLEDVIELFGLTDDVVSRVGQRQAGSSSLREWVLEFETMLSHSESSQQEVFYYELSQSGLPVRNQMSEVQGKTYTYAEAAEK